MKRVIGLFSVLFLFANLALGQARKKAEEDTFEWRYEIEVVNTGTQGTKQVKVWTYSKKANVAMEQAQKNAVHGIIFKGMPDKGAVRGDKAMATDPNLETTQEEFFKEFFKDGGKYSKYVTLVNNGAIAAGDVMKVGKEYKVGVIVSVNTAGLRKDLEQAGIIKALTNGF
jgi:hypothetical protein